MEEILPLSEEQFTTLITESGTGEFLVFGGILFIALAIGIAVYLYVAFALMTLAKKMKIERPWLAFIPVANLYLMSRMAKMHWWPVLLVIGTLFSSVSEFFGFALTIFAVIWMWKIFEEFKKPGWWAILMPIPFLSIIYWVLLGMTAWGKTELEVEKKEE
jgi:hypothetical protein